MSPTPRRFTILHHTGYGREHWDLLLEQDETLLTWQLWRNPVTDLPKSQQVTRIGDHRKIYLDYEGPVSGDRGHVTALDRGEVTFISHAPARLDVQLAGELVNGRFVLTQDDDGIWQLQSH